MVDRIVGVSEAMLLSQPVFLDVRAPVEFARGAVPGAVNRPILDDQQRAEIGTLYTEAGHDAAIARGLQLATPAIRKQRLASWCEHARAHPNGYLYCLRGGLRSRTTQAWLRDAGVDYPLIQGGYKALRAQYREALARLCSDSRLIVIAGQTGSGKTELIQSWRHSLDLEARARHRGSAFGATFDAQPSQIDFENRITLDWMLLAAERDAPVLIEAESRLIGRVYVPDALQRAMQHAPCLSLQAPKKERVNRLRSDYVDHALAHFERAGDQAPHASLSEFVTAGLERIRRRLGSQETDRLVAAVPDAVLSLQHNADPSGFDAIIESLLECYYDRLYAHKSCTRAAPIYTGSQTELLEWLSKHTT